MEANKLKILLDKMNLPVTNTKFPEGIIVNPPFIVFKNTSIDRFLADNSVYVSDDNYAIEIYTKDFRNINLEKRLIKLFNENEIVWNFLSSEEVSNGVVMTVYEI